MCQKGSCKWVAAQHELPVCRSAPESGGVRAPRPKPFPARAVRTASQTRAERFTGSTRNLAPQRDSVPRPKRDRQAEREAADRAFETAKRKDKDVTAGLMNGEQLQLPVIDDEVLTTAEKLRLREPQPVTTYRVCETCGGHGSRWRLPNGALPATSDDCINCGGLGRVPVTREMTEQEKKLLGQVTE